MAQPRKSTKTSDGKRICYVCKTPKSALDYASTSATTCSECLTRAPAPVATESFTPPVAEIDYSNPSAQELAARTLARRRLMSFIKRFRPKYMAGWVHEDICRRLERFLLAVERQESPRMVLMMPVRMGKSEIGSRHFAPWLLGHHPEWEVIAASGGQTLALTFSRYIRDLMRDPSYQALFPDTKLDPSSQSVENWNTTGGGGYMAAGIGTMIVGRGAHVLLIDDPCTSAEAADSQVQRDSVWEWYIANALNRLAPGGGVLGIMCMTGDTPVLMADSTERRLDALKVGNAVATFEQGHLSTSTVVGLKSNGLDSILKIRTSSGKMVRANGRHPFLATIDGELKWIRARSLTTANKIVTTKASGVSGRALPVKKMGAKNLLNAGGTATHTTQRKDGPMGIALQPTEQSLAAQLASSTDTESLSPSTTPCSQRKTDSAQSVVIHRSKVQVTGEVTSPLTTATRQEKSEGCCATVATPGSDSLELSPLHWPQPNTSDFTLDDIVSIEPDGVEEVFDVQIERTENFIANGVVSHNTHWNEDDWAGRVQQLSKLDDGGDKFEIVKYPAINDIGDEYILTDDSIEQFPPGSDIPPGARLTRRHNTPLHEERYTLKMLMNTKATYFGLGQQRWWAALYQQSPSLDDGVFFTSKMFKFYLTEPHALERSTYQTWDFAITEKQKSDYTVGATGHVDKNNNLHVADVVRFKSDDAYIIADAILDNWVEHGSCALLGFEDGQIWKAVSAVFLRRCEERKLFPAYELLVPLTDKGVRAMPLKGLMQSGKVWFKQGAGWWEVVRKEMTQFLSGGKHDDTVDALAWLARLALKHSAPKAPEPKPMKSWKDKLGTMLKGRNGGHMSA